MVPITSLLVPIVLSAVAVFIVSSVIHMLLTYHRSDFSALPREDDVLQALRGFDIPPGDYVIPCPGSPKEMSSPEFVEKCTRGPVAFATFCEPGPPSMGGSLALWFVYSLLVGVFAAYVGGRALGPGAEYLAVFQIVGTVAFMGYGLALLQNSIWYKRNWGATLKSVFDGLIYGLFTAGMFGWLWP